MIRVTLVPKASKHEVVIGLDNIGIFGLGGYFVQVYENDEMLFNKSGLTGIQAFEAIREYTNTYHRATVQALCYAASDLDPALIQGPEMKHQAVDLNTEEYSNRVWVISLLCPKSI